jgi:tetratricopeptide repeat protein
MKRQNDPDIPGDISAKDLDPSVLQDLRSLSKDNADTVARHMVMAAIWMEDDPQLALRHARAAKDRAGRVSVVRETAGIAAYHAGEWKEALTELRAARRISGGPGMLAVMADCERGLGHPDKALELGRTEDLSGLDDDSRVELAIVLAGARADMGDFDSAVVELKSVGLENTRSDITSMRLFYAFADCLVQAGRGDEAREWFLRSAELDTEGVLDARERAADLES